MTTAALFAPCVGGEALVMPLAVIGLTGVKIDSLVPFSLETIAYSKLVPKEHQMPVIVVLLQTQQAVNASIARSKRRYTLF